MNSKIKIAHVVTAYQSVITILDSKLRRLNEMPYVELYIISSGPKEEDARKPSAKFIPVEISRKIHPVSDISSILKLSRLFRQEGFDIVHSHTAKAGFVTAMAGKLAKVTLICHTYHGLPFFKGQRKVAYHSYRMLERFACKLRHYVFSQNQSDLTDCADLIGNKERVFFEGNGVNPEFIRESAEIQSFEAEKDYPPGEIRLAMISRLEPIKRVSDFLKTVKLIRQQGIKVSAVIAGTGVLEPKLRQEMKRLKIDDCVNMVGFSDRTHGIIAESDIVVLCSEKEGIPRAIMEAMALKKPIVATDVLGTQEVVVDGGTGFLAPLGDIRALVERIKILIKNPLLRETMGNNGAKRVEHSYNDVKIATFLHDFYMNHLDLKKSN